MPVGATYRFQLGPEFDLHRAADLVDYLADLGVTHIYCSPFLQSAPESPHGYAVVDHHRVDDRLGGEEGRRRLVEAAASAGLGIVLDLVPNHMSVSLPSNRWFWDVLEHGRSSRYAAHFDLDWDPAESLTENKILLPVLGDHYGREIEAGALRVERQGHRFVVCHHDHPFPVSPRSLATLLARAARPGPSDELAFVGRTMADLPPADVSDGASRRRRHRDFAVLGTLLADLLTRPDVGKAVDQAVEELNADADALDEFLEMQHYRLARWQVSEQELGYRRFFDINTLIGLRVEDEEVFSDSHETVLGWVSNGEADGLRIDHPDGLRRPADYLRRLRDAAPTSWIVVEKILESDEVLPAEWPVDGTTGYEFLNDLTRLLVDPEGEEELTRLWNRVSGSDEPWDRVAESSKRDVVEHVLAADVNRLTDVFHRLIQQRRRYRDFTRSELAAVLTETLVAFDVYRTYVSELGESSPADVERITGAVSRARHASPDLDSELFDLLQSVLIGEMRGARETELRMRFQQLSGPVMAKGVEDTAFYRYSRLTALCEVGGDPGRFGFEGVEAFHRRFVHAHERAPTSMLALSTHDTKRSEDVRARLAVLTEIPAEWRQAVLRWGRHNVRHRTELVDGATEYLIYQTLVGAHPIGADRLGPYIEKATKEAKVHTTWTDPDTAYDGQVADFVRRLDGDDEFRQDLDRFAAPVVEAGRINSLTQKAIQLTAPGVPDTYQGTELWDLSLVDPDNRRPVEFEGRKRLLGELAGIGPDEVLGRMDEGLPKLWLIHTLLHLRRRFTRALGQEGGYVALETFGSASSHALGYVRGEQIAVVVPRLVYRLQRSGGWEDTSVALPPGVWEDVFTGRSHQGEVEISGLLHSFPVSVLARV
ncbi:MAG TPA: malto-oligosyltrehalose synthase [Acidimicrobiia bacterium]|nr:malto-oligosyltrehalose synthase [Acidimicrobiia bacterium]